MTEQPDNIAAEEFEASPTRKRRWPIWVGGILLLLVAWNAVITIPVMSALSDEDGITSFAYRRWLVSPGQIVFDVWSVDGSKAMVDVDRNLFKAAERLKDRSYDGVVLAYRGQGKFILDGRYFQEIGVTRQTQNPVYTIRTMQEHLLKLDGTPAFGTWSGGWLGVIGKQMEDHNDFHHRWWIRSALGISEDAADSSPGAL